MKIAYLMYFDHDKANEIAAIVNELIKHDPALGNKPRWLALNKLDLIPEEEREELIQSFVTAYKRETDYDGPVFALAAISGEGTKPLIYALGEALEEMGRREVTVDNDDEEEFEASFEDDDLAE